MNSAADEATPMPFREQSDRVMYFSSTRSGGLTEEAVGATVCDSDLYVSVAAAETRPSLSWDATTLYFCSTRPGGEGSIDHYMTTREKVTD